MLIVRVWIKSSSLLCRNWPLPNRRAVLYAWPNGSLKGGATVSTGIVEARAAGRGAAGLVKKRQAINCQRLRLRSGCLMPVSALPTSDRRKQTTPHRAGYRSASAGVGARTQAGWRLTGPACRHGSCENQ